MAAVSLCILVSSSFQAPAITMMQNSVTPSNYGNVVGVYKFTTTLVQTMSALVFGLIANKVGAVHRPSLYGPLISSFVIFGYSIASFFYWRAGRYYRTLMQRQHAQP